MKVQTNQPVSEPGFAPSKRRLLGYVAALMATASMFAHAPALAENYPDKPVRVVVPFPPGGSSDTAARIITKELASVMKQNFIVENKAGAAGTIGVSSVTRATPDGYTLGEAPVGATIIAKLIGMQVPYDPVKEIVSIGNIGSLPLVFAVKADLPVNNVAELVALAKAKPGTLSYGTSGAGTPGHLAFEYFKNLAGVDILHVPYKGDSPLTTDLLGGQVDIGILTGPAALPQAKNEKLKFLAVTSGERYPQMAQVPTLIESGYKDFNIEIWNLLFAPQGTDAKILDSLSKAMNKALEKGETKETLTAQGFLPPVLMTPAQTAEFVANERTKWETIVKTTGVKIEN